MEKEKSINVEKSYVIHKDKMNPCRIVLLNPPTAADSNEPLLNLAYLSSTLKKAGHDVLVLDATAPYCPLNEKEIEKKILEFNPHFIGVTLTITNILKTYGYLKRLGQLSIPIVAGGPHANCLPEEVLHHGADIVAIGEGEKTILDLAGYFLGRKKLEEIPGLCFRKRDSSVCYTQMRPLIKDLDLIPFPDFSFFPISHYSGIDDPDSSSIFWAIFSSRGCPYNCIFCSSHNVFGRTFRIRSAENVFEEVEKLAEEYGARHFAFQDDEAFINKERILSFCNLVSQSQYKLSFSARLRIDSLDEKMLINMKNAGFTRLAFGIESFNDESLLKMNKMYTSKDIFDGFEKLERANFRIVHFNNLVGFPWETPEHLEDCIKKISKIPKSIIFFSAVNTLIPFPNTKMYADYHEQYGFTDWWIDKDKVYRPFDPRASKTFFMLFLSMYGPLYYEDIFWKHSKKMKKAIHDFCWKIASMQLKRCLSFWEYFLVFNLSKASYYVWKRSPLLENIVFYIPKTLVKLLKIHEKADFTKY